MFLDALAEADKFAATGELPVGFDLSLQPPEEADAAGQAAEQQAQEEALGKAPGRPRGAAKGGEGKGTGAC